MRPCWNVAALLAVGFASMGARAEEILNVGDPAPPLKVGGWVKGEKVEGFAPGKTYVVEFWATWCGPCKDSIPHLTELAHKHKDVAFLGIDVREEDPKQVEPFVKAMGEKMDYRVAVDEVSAGGDGRDGAMFTGWLKAADERGIPSAFVVRDGKIAWIGHPMGLDEPLAKILGGDWDLKVAAEERVANRARAKEMARVQQQVFEPFRAKDYPATLAAIRKQVESDPGLAERYEWVEFACLCNGVDVEKGLALGKKIMKAHEGDAGMLNTMSWLVVDPANKVDPDPRVARLALEASRRAVELTKGEDPANLDTLATALYWTGDAAEAVEVEEKALKRAEAEAGYPESPELKPYRASLERFRKAATEQAKRR